MKKYLLDLTITAKIFLNDTNVLFKLTAPGALPEMLPGQFAEIRIDGSPTTFLRRPISINFVDRAANEVWFLIQTVGDGTRQLARLREGDIMNVMLPLGNSFTLPPAGEDGKLLLVGGGVGTAPMLFLGEQLQRRGFQPTFLLGAKRQKDLLLLDEFARFGTVYTTTEDGSYGEQGFVAHHSILKEPFDRIYTCGPKPMMVNVARYAKAKNIACEVSLENTMACGIGACLCCVENTTDGHLCVCTEGPVFNINKLLWQI